MLSFNAARRRNGRLFPDALELEIGDQRVDRVDVAGALHLAEAALGLRGVAFAQRRLPDKESNVAGARAAHRSVTGGGADIRGLELAEEEGDQRAGPLVEIDLGGIGGELVGVVAAGAGAGDVAARRPGKASTARPIRGSTPRCQRFLEIGGSFVEATGDELRRSRARRRCPIVRCRCPWRRNPSAAV